MNASKNELEAELQRRGLMATAGDDEEAEIDGEHEVDPRLARKKIPLTPELVAKAVEASKVTDLTQLLPKSKHLTSDRTFSSDFKIGTAYEIAVRCLDQASKDWRKKYAIIYHGDQMVVVEAPEAQVAQQLAMMVAQHEVQNKPRGAHKPKEPKEPKAPKAAKEPGAEKPKRAPRKPKVEE